MKNVAPNWYFFRIGRATVKCDFDESSKVSTTSLSGIGSSVNAGEASRSITSAARVMLNPRVQSTSEPILLRHKSPVGRSIENSAVPQQPFLFRKEASHWIAPNRNRGDFA